MIDSDDHARQFGGILAGQILAMIALASGLIETGVVNAGVFIRSLEVQREKFRMEKVPADMLAPMDAVLRALREAHPEE